MPDYKFALDERVYVRYLRQWGTVIRRRGPLYLVDSITYTVQLDQPLTTADTVQVPESGLDSEETPHA